MRVREQVTRVREEVTRVQAIGMAAVITMATGTTVITTMWERRFRGRVPLLRIWMGIPRITTTATGTGTGTVTTPTTTDFYYGNEGQVYEGQVYDGQVPDRQAPDGKDVSPVLQVQRRLARGGYYHGTIYGVIGGGTRGVIRAYERSLVCRSMASSMIICWPQWVLATIGLS